MPLEPQCLPKGSPGGELAAFGGLKGAYPFALLCDGSLCQGVYIPEY